MSDETARRRFGRFQRELAVQLEMPGGEVHEGLSVDIGLGGLRVSTAAELEFDQVLTVHLVVPQPEQEVVAGGRVMWVRDESVGIAFDALRPMDVWALLQYFNLSAG